jgi:signal peptidase I
LLHKKSKKTIKYILLIALAVAIIWIGIRIAFGVDNPLYNVASDSMVPNLNVGDFVIISHNIPFNKLQVGDIIVFKSPAVMEEGKQETIVHRVAKIVTNFHGSRVIVTKGDANPDSMSGIDYPIREENYLGKVTYVVPKLGLITRVITPPINYILIAIVLGV